MPENYNDLSGLTPKKPFLFLSSLNLYCTILYGPLKLGIQRRSWSMNDTNVCTNPESDESLTLMAVIYKFS